MIQGIKPGDLIHRVYPSGRRTVGIAGTYTGIYEVVNGNIRFNPTGKFDRFYGLENHNYEGRMVAGDGFGHGYKYTYERVEPGSFWWYHYMSEFAKRIEITGIKYLAV